MQPTEEDLACLWYNGTEERLSCLNNIKARLYLPVTVFLAVLALVGTLGNTTVCLVYWRRTSRMSSHYFILALAILDLLTCVLGMPTEIADLSLPYTFRSPMACKVMRFIHSTTIIASSTILIQVAFDRYYRICKLGRQFTANKAKFLCFGAFILGMICSWPSVILFGRKTVTLRLGGEILKGEDCSTDDTMRGTIYPTIYYAFLFSLFGMTVAFFGVLYAKIGLTILKRKRLGMGSSSGHHGRGGSWRKKSKIAGPSSSDFSSGHECGEKGQSTASSSYSHSSHDGDSYIKGKLFVCGAGNTKRSKTGPEGEGARNSAELERKECRRNKEMAKSCRSSPRQSKELVDEGSRQRCGTMPQENLKKSRYYDNIDESGLKGSYGKHRSCGSLNQEGSKRSGQSKRSPNMPPRNENIPGPIPRINKTLVTSSSTAALASIIVESLNSPQMQCPDKSSKDPQSPKSPSEKIRAFFFHFHHQTHHQETVIGTHTETQRPREPEGRSRQTPKVYRKHFANESDGEHAGTPISPTPSGRQLRVGKTTTVLFAVTLAYILSFLPYLIVMVMRSIVKDLEQSLSPTGELAYKFCVKSFFINNAINPLIYSFLNQSFRQDARTMFARVCRRRESLPRG